MLNAIFLKKNCFSFQCDLFPEYLFYVLFKIIVFFLNKLFIFIMILVFNNLFLASLGPKWNIIFLLC
ncbi:hypothetical protein A6J39_009720 [Legionella anisa]|uniref:Uncharacterized protein n=1 Tax=Legionella anisa TaxID=28082 RepID=A0AAX0WSZ4_9GAMM|nr:hypothetical protein DLD14_12745 [Legionella anisa]PNL61467.1 hypothetical protein A6J39_009720 [Legionella anisa]